MSKRRKRRYYSGPVTRQQMQERQQQRELREAQQGYIEESSAEIAAHINEETKGGDMTLEDVIDASTFQDYPEDDPEPKREKPRRWYVLDTNLIISQVDVLYDPEDENWREPEEFKPKLDHAHLIIPKVVFDELDHMKDEGTYRSVVARTALKRLTKFFPNSEHTLRETMYLEDPVETGLKDQTISLLPLHKNFYKILPWAPERDDNDGWIAVTALAATMIRNGLPVDGTLKYDGQESEPFDIMDISNEKKDVVLLTNDNGLLSKADLYGVRTKPYSFKQTEIFTGCRELTVPAKMFEQFYHEEKLSRADFERFMPRELPLVANEYIVMTPEDDRYPRGYFTVPDDFVNIARFHAENGYLYPLRFMKHEGKTPPNAGIATYYDALNDDKIKVVNVTGSAGTGKTFQAVTHAIKEVRAGHYIQAIVIPSRSAKNPLGALPGNQDQKMEPLIGFVKDAIRSYLAQTPEFIKKREALYRHGDIDRDREDFEEEKKPKKPKDGRDGRERRDYLDSRRTFNNFTGSPDSFDYGDGYSARDFGEPHKKKDKAFYQGKSEKPKNDGSEGKLTYREMLEKEVNYLYNRYFVSMPYEDASSHSFEDSIIILDEFQRVLIDDADTLITRPAKGSKLIVCGDIDQIENATEQKRFNNGLNYSRMLYFDESICANVHLTETMRGDIARVATKNRDKVRRLMGVL